MSFPKLPIVGKRPFTFTAAQATEACAHLDPRVIIPIHRDGWPHFRQPAEEFRSALTDRFGERVRWLALGDTTTI